jgi:DNA primase
MPGLVPQHQIDAILAKVNIVDVIGQYLPLKRSGTYFAAQCPFHGDKDPSFMVSDARQFYHCFGCGENGNAASFLMKYQGYTFREAITQLAERAGVEIRLEQDAGPRPPSRREYVDTNALATSFFAEQLRLSDRARAYVKRRGLSDEIVERFGIGYAPQAWDSLALHLARSGRDAIERAEELGLIRVRKSGQGHYDMFRDRLQFPITNQDGRVVAFSGRDLSGADDAPKYVNSPESRLYSKGRLLFGIHQAREALRKERVAVVVEGNVDVVAMHQAGLTMTVAPLGTSLTQQQAQLLKRVSDDVVFLYDGDPAGIRAAFKALRVCLQAELHPRVALLPEGEDPDSFVRAQGVDAARRLVDAAPRGLDLLIDRAMSKAGDSPADRARAAERVVQVLADVQSNVERELYAQRLAERVGVEVGAVLGQVGPVVPVIQSREAVVSERKYAMDLFRVCVEDPSLLELMSDERLALIRDGALHQLFRKAVEVYGEQGRLPPEVVHDVALPEGLKHRVIECFLEESRTSGEVRGDQFGRLVGQLQYEEYKRQFSELQARLKRIGGDPEHTSTMLDIQRRQQELLALMRTIENYRKGGVHVEEVS